jgi:hypothetical protein
MRFWDASAIVPLLLDEPESPALRQLLRGDAGLVVWWGTPVECASAIARVARDGTLASQEETTVLDLLRTLERSWHEILPATAVRQAALRLLRVHPLRAADALQLAAALVWAAGDPQGLGLVTRDDRLADAARREGFEVL